MFNIHYREQLLTIVDTHFVNGSPATKQSVFMISFKIIHLI